MCTGIFAIHLNLSSQVKNIVHIKNHRRHVGHTQSTVQLKLTHTYSYILDARHSQLIQLKTSIHLFSIARFNVSGIFRPYTENEIEQMHETGMCTFCFG